MSRPSGSGASIGRPPGWDAEFHCVLGELSLSKDPIELDRAKASLESALKASQQHPAPFLVPIRRPASPAHS